MQIKHFVPLLTALALCALAACGGSGESASASSPQASSAQGQVPTALDRYRGVLLGEDAFLYLDGENAPASLEISQVPALFSPDSSYAAVSWFAIRHRDAVSAISVASAVSVLSAVSAVSALSAVLHAPRSRAADSRTAAPLHLFFIISPSL